MPTDARAIEVRLRRRERERNLQSLHRRGGVLFEAMLALALFVGAAAFTLAAVRSVARTLERSRLQQEAVDLARSSMAELEAGLTTLAGLRGETDGTASGDAADFDESSAPPRWRIEVASSRSEFGDLSLVELTVIENRLEPEDVGESRMRFTLRQLVALRDDKGEPFRDDELTEGLQKSGSAR